ncbi:MAG TPA: sensor histidine kinase [Longimicrobiales bacterium]
MIGISRKALASPRAPWTPPRFLRPLLRVPLFTKILVANSVIVIAAVAAGTALTAELVRARPSASTLELVGLTALAGVFVSVVVNALILRLALSPLGVLERTAGAVRAGALHERAPVSPLADRGLERLTRTFNAMLDGLEGYRFRLREVAARALRAEEEERKRIARELHDETAQSLSAMLIRLSMLRRVQDPGAREAGMEELRQQLVSTLDGVRRYARGLRPPALDDLGLVPAIEQFARTLAEATGLRVQIDAGRLDGPLTSEVELVVYRIVQEALSNVVRHAGATTVRVMLECRDANLVALVEDDGRGFVVQEVLRGDGEGLGLFGMRERASYVGGHVDIESEPGAGTRVRAVIPLAEDGTP